MHGPRTTGRRPAARGPARLSGTLLLLLLLLPTTPDGRTAALRGAMTRGLPNRLALRDPRDGEGMVHMKSGSRRHPRVTHTRRIDRQGLPPRRSMKTHMEATRPNGRAPTPEPRPSARTLPLQSIPTADQTRPRLRDPSRRLAPMRGIPLARRPRRVRPPQVSTWQITFGRSK
jgi:hypothetical protein